MVFNLNLWASKYSIKLVKQHGAFHDEEVKFRRKNGAPFRNLVS